MYILGNEIENNKIAYNSCLITLNKIYLAAFLYTNLFEGVVNKMNSGDSDERKYIDTKGQEVFISAGLGSNEYGSFRKSKSGGLHRVKSSMMPMVSFKEEAQKNLDLWANKNKLQSVN